MFTVTTWKKPGWEYTSYAQGAVVTYQSLYTFGYNGHQPEKLLALVEQF